MDAHPHDPATRRAQALLRTRYGQLMDRSVVHVRVDYHPQHRARQQLTVIGTARELHGPQGCCSCCPRRPKLTVDGDVVG